MDLESRKNRQTLEIMLIVVVIGLAGLFLRMGPHGMLGLNLFFLPVMLGGYFLGRTHAGILSLLATLLVAIAASAEGGQYSGYSSPVAIGLALTVWAAALGLMSILIGTLCDERLRTVKELQKAYVGVVEVLSKYLQGANSRVKARSTRVAELSQAVAQEMRLPRRQIDDVRVAALLHDLESVEITTQIASRAVSALESSSSATNKHTFLGTDLVQSLGHVLEGALPLLVSQDELLRTPSGGDAYAPTAVPSGAKVIAVVRGYDALVSGSASGFQVPPTTAIEQLRQEMGATAAAELDALERVVLNANSQVEIAAA